MAVLSGATASGRKFYQGQPPTGTATTLYTAPASTTNVPNPYATAYIKEIIMCNTTASPTTVTLYVDGGGLPNQIVSQLTVNGYDTKVLSGLNTMVDPNGIIAGLQGTANAITVTISGVEVQ